MIGPLHGRLKYAVITVVVLAAAGGAWWWSHRTTEQGPLVLQGNVEVRQVNLGFKVGGRIKSMAVDEGATVRAGQILASLDKIYFEEALAQSRAQTEQDRANLAKLEAGNRPEEIAQADAAVAEREATVTNAQILFDRADQLLKTGTGSRRNYDDAMAVFRQAAAQLNSARQAQQLMKAGARAEDIEAARARLAMSTAAMAAANRQLTDADLIAPSDGVVLTRARETGAIVNVGETAFVVSLTSPVWVRTYVAEPDLGRIHPGQDVECSSDTKGLEPFKGHIGFISTTAEFTPKTVETQELRTSLVYRVRIVADDPGGRLRQGMPITIRVLPSPTPDVAKADGAVK